MIGLRPAFIVTDALTPIAFPCLARLSLGLAQFPNLFWSRLPTLLDDPYKADVCRSESANLPSRDPVQQSPSHEFDVVMTGFRRFGMYVFCHR